MLNNMSGFKRIIQGNKNRSQEQTPEEEKPATVSSVAINKKPSLFRRPRETPTAEPANKQPPSNQEPHHLTKHGSKTAQETSEIAHLENQVSNLRTDTTAEPPKPRHSDPHAPGDLFRMGQLPLAADINLKALLQQSLRHVTIKRAAAARYSVVTALSNLRELSVLTGVVEQYLPYALTCWDIAELLKKKGTNVSKGVKWSSGLAHGEAATTEYEGGFGLEVVLILTLSALCKMRGIVETAGNFGLQDGQTLVTQIKSLQVAAGMFDYTCDNVAPKAMADFVGKFPPELVPEVSSLFSSLSLCLAQALHVRRAVLSSMSVATLAKLSAAAKDLATEVLAKFDKVTRLGVTLTSDVKTVADDIMTLTTGWTLQYLGATTQANVDSGAKIASLRKAIATLNTASSSRILGKVAVLDLQDLEKQLADAVDENRVVFQHVIPDANDLRLPQGRSLVSATAYDAARIPNSNRDPREQ